MGLHIFYFRKKFQHVQLLIKSILVKNNNNKYEIKKFNKKFKMD